jgi:hypothetical protein
MKKILIGCEESQSLTIEFRKLGIEAYSCDLLDCSGGHPEWHIKDDLLFILNQEDWHTSINFPPCTYLCKAQMHLKDKERLERRTEAVEFFMKIGKSKVPRIAIENPIGFINTNFKHPNQIISPHEFGDPYQKDICLWLKNMPLLKGNKPVIATKTVSNHVNGRMTNEERSKIKSSWKFFPKMCKEIANQWSREYENKYRSVDISGDKAQDIARDIPEDRPGY